MDLIMNSTMLFLLLNQTIFIFSSVTVHLLTELEEVGFFVMI